MIDKGIQPFSGKVVHLGAHQRKQSTLNEAKDQSGVFRFGELTPGFALIYVIPLLLIFLGFDAFTEEKENQTLRLLLVQGATRRQLAQGKWLALFIQMIVLWLFLFAAAFIGTLLLADEVQPSLIEDVKPKRHLPALSDHICQPGYLGILKGRIIRHFAHDPDRLLDHLHIDCP